MTVSPRLAPTPPDPGAGGDALPTDEAEALGAVVRDLGLDERELARLGAGGDAPHRLAVVRAERRLVGRTFAALDGELAEGGTFLLALRGAASDRDLAAWRDALWPLLHVGAVYRAAEGQLVRRRIGGSETVAPAPSDLAVLVARRRALAMSPDATVAKFDRNATGWGGEPGGAGYPHFRWMRRYVGRFAPVPDGARVLDFGCGAGWVGIEAALSARDVRLRAFDPSPEMVRIAGENARACGVADFEARTGFGEDPPYPAGGEEPFDLVACSGVVSFAPDLDAWVDGLVGTVRPGGDLVVGDANRDSRGFRRRRARKPLLPVRELNARSREEVRAALEDRGLKHLRSAGYQLTWPVPELMHLNERRLGGALTHPLLWLNRAAARLDRTFGSPLQDHFDSWVMHFTRPS